MSLYDQLPDEYIEAKPVLDRLLKVNAASLRDLQGSRRKPDAPRNIIAQAGSLRCVLTWNAPSKGADDIRKWRVYVDSEKNLYKEISDITCRQVEISMTGESSRAVFVSSVNGRGQESPKIPAIASSNTDQIVVTGTTGGTGGEIPPPPPEWEGEGGFDGLPIL